MLLGAFNSFAQTVLISPTVNNGGFESGTTGWTFVQETTSTTDANRWEVGGNSTPFAGSNAAYITTGASGVPYAYNITPSVVRTAHMYRDVTFPGGETSITFNFQWKAYGESGYDRLLIYIAPTSITPTSGIPASNSTTFTGATLLWTQPTYSSASGSSYNTANVTLTAAQAGNTSSNSTMRLLFVYQSDQSVGGQPPASVDNINLTTSCTGAAATTASSITTTTATLNWTAFASASGYNVRYKKVSDPATVTTWATPTAVSGGSTTSLPVSSLTPATPYEYQVSAVGSGICAIYSASSLFTTLCNTSPIPQNQGFNVANNTATPLCWATTVTVPSGNSYPAAVTYETASSYPSGYNPTEGTRMVRFNSFDCSSGSQVRLSSLPVSTTGAPQVEVEFKWLNSSNLSGSNDYVQLQYSFNGTTWTNFGSPVTRYASPTAWSTKTVALPPAAGNQPIVYIGFLFVSLYGYDCYVDDVKIRKVPTCFPPTALNVTNVKHNTATLGWTAPTLGTPQNYEYVVSTTSTPPTGAGTSASGTSQSLTSLTPSTTYYVYMRSNCGSGDISDWTSAPAISFTTSCAPVAMPLIQPFAAGLPSCWSGTEASAGSSTHWTTGTADGSHGVSGPKAGTHLALLDVYNALTSYNPYYLNLPPVTLVNGLNTIAYYYYLGNSGYTSSSNPPLEVQVATSVSGPWTSLYTHTSSNSTMATSTATTNWYENVVNLTGYNGQTVYLRYKSMSNYGSGICNQGLDEIRILPKKPTTTSASQCGTGTPTVSATSQTGVASPSFRWYTVATGGTAIAGQTGATLSSYPISSTTPFYVSEVVGGVESERTAVTATVTTATSINTHPSPVWTCDGANAVFTCSAAGSGTVTYTWEYNATGTGTYTPVTNGGKYAGATTNTLTITGVTVAEVGSYRCRANSNCGPINSNPGWLTVVPQPSVTITASANTICAGQNVSFAATASDAGTPSYQWRRNNTNVGTNSPAYSNAALTNNDVIECIITSTANCPVKTKDTSNQQIITVNPLVSTSLTITSDWGTQGCVAVPVTFTATPVNPGGNPTYQWKRNGSNVGSNSPVYKDSTMASGSIIRCEMASSVGCPNPANAVSNSITMTIIPVGYATVSVKPSPDSIGCEGAAITFYSSFTNGGNNPRYKWMKNGTLLPNDTTATYTTSMLADNDQISVELKSSQACVFPVTSSPITVDLEAVVVPTATITGEPIGNGILFTANITNGGSYPTLQWRKNDIDIPGANTTTFTASGLNLDDEISLWFVSDLMCAAPKAVSSNKLTPLKVTGINNISQQFSDMSLYPNPNTGEFNLRGTLLNAVNNKEAKIEIMNALGQVVYKTSSMVSGKELDIKVNMGGAQAAGMYMLYIDIDGNKNSLRFVLK